MNGTVSKGGGQAARWCWPRRQRELAGCRVINLVRNSEGPSAVPGSIRSARGMWSAHAFQRFASGNPEQIDAIIITRRMLCSGRRYERLMAVMKVNKTKKHGFTLVEIMIVVAIIGL